MIAIPTNKRTNIGTTLRCGVALGCNYVIIVGDMNYGTHGAHGSQTRIKVIHFYNWQEFHQFALENNCITYGVVDTDFPLPHSLVTSTEFQDKMAIFVTAPKSGRLSQEQIDVCDAFIAVPFSGGLQLAKHVHGDVKLSICLHEYAASRNLEADRFVGEKFVLSDSKPQVERFESKSIQSVESSNISAEVILSDIPLFETHTTDY